jgi:2,3-bisphosphoglycerate-independent phosphoglycerate mutase
MKNKKVCLIIRDGWGRGKEEDKNAIYMAKTPNTDRYEKDYPTTLINTSGLSVGLPEGYQGNSEVGHLNIGAGRVVYQSLTRIDKSIKDGDFFENEAFLEGIKIAKSKNSTIHLIGLIQEEGVHSVTRHCISLLKMIKDNDYANVNIHAITDGRDTPPKSAHGHLSFLQEGIDKIGIGKIVSLTGRYYTMDRDTNWNRTEIGYRAIMEGKGKKIDNWKDGIEDAYANGETDEFIKPRVIDYDGIGKDDLIIFFNFRFDRTRQITKAIVEKGFSEFKTISHNISYIAMTHYYDNGNFKEAFPELKYKNIFGEVLANNGLNQLRCAETEKYAHVTFFFNALNDTPFENEDRILVKSPKVATYDLQPEMSAYEVRDKLLAAIESEKYDVIICNFANCDMVGHTGVYPAIIEAVEVVDKCVGEIVEKMNEKGGVSILTADHGNADKTTLEDGSPMTAHTKNPVPITIINNGNLKLREDGSLCDIIPTILEIMNIEKPVEMTGISLINGG